MLRNTTQKWGSLSRGFHWLTVALLLVQIPLGFWMVEVYEVYTETYADDTWVVRTSTVHHTIGFIVLATVVLRYSWRLNNTTPDLPATLVRYQQLLARITHIVLYSLLLIYPLSGWAALSAYEGEFPIYFFGWDSVPRLVPQVPEGATFDYPFFAEIHRACWKVGAAVLGLHVVAALWHQLVVGDDALRRMWSGKSSHQD
ncbi:MAG: cytochrome b [Gammaproteobacteria bacterium]